MKAYDSVLVAKYIRAIANSKGKLLNITQTQKLLYILYGYFAGKKNFPLLNEAPKAWPYGPVFPRTRIKVDYSVVYTTDMEDFNDIRSDTSLTSIVNQIVAQYSKYSAGQLSAWSHEEGSPWHKTTRQQGFVWGNEIPYGYIKDYFEGYNFGITEA